MKIHHILANGKEVESVAGKVINVSEFPMLSSVFRSVINEFKNRQPKTKKKERNAPTVGQAKEERK